MKEGGAGADYQRKSTAVVSSYILSQVPPIMAYVSLQSYFCHYQVLLDIFLGEDKL